MKKGLLITFEGGDGSGKTTQMEKLKAWFEANNLPFIVTHEPGGTKLGEDIRTILKHAKYEITPRSEMLLFNASRAELIDEVIKPALNNRIHVICDRFTDSHIAYQGFGRGLDISDVAEISNYATAGITPDVTFWLDIDPIEGFKRTHGDLSDRMEQSGMEFHKQVYKGYQHLYHNNKKRIVRLDATKSIDEIFDNVIKVLEPKLK